MVETKGSKPNENVGSKPEIERSFLVKKMPENYSNYPHKEIKTGYLVIKDGYEIRIRQNGDVFEKITKIGKGLSKIEIAHLPLLTKEDFDSQWQTTIASKAETRYFIPINGGTAELKIMHEQDEGKGEVEVEFDSEDEAKNFIPPDWFGRELTNDDRYASGNLVLNGFPEEAKLPL